MPYTSLLKLIKSMSKEEKRKFKLSTKKQCGQKDYLDLFEIIEKSPIVDVISIKEKFQEMHPEASVENTARYLFKTLTDSLIHTKIKEDNTFSLYYGLLRVKLLQERSLEEEGYKELKKLKTLAIKSQNNFLQFIIYRHELNHISNFNFVGHTEQDLIETQMKAREVLKNSLQTHEHYSLYESLKYRLLHSPKISSDEDKKKRNDLILSEMSLISVRGKNSFESQKLHLLFQSFFFTDIGDFKSALRTFYVLNQLFEKNVFIWDSPPLDYLSSLDGILDSLRAIGYYEEMDFYLNKMEQLAIEAYPEFFRVLVRKTIIIYQLAILTKKKKFEKALEVINNIEPNLFPGCSIADDEKQNELLFYLALSYFGIGDIKKAKKYINEIVLIRKINYQSLIYKASRLLNILIYYEGNELEYLDYEIRSYKRTFQNKMKLLKTEVAIFKTVKLNPNKNGAQKNEILWKKLLPTIKIIEKDKYEMQLGKYLNFAGWVESKFLK